MIIMIFGKLCCQNKSILNRQTAFSEDQKPQYLNGMFDKCPCIIAQPNCVYTHVSTIEILITITIENVPINVCSCVCVCVFTSSNKLRTTDEKWIVWKGSAFAIDSYLYIVNRKS